jgi:hypothetical protein
MPARCGGTLAAADGLPRVLQRRVAFAVNNALSHKQIDEKEMRVTVK